MRQKKILDLQVKDKQCSKCKLLKPLSDFRKCSKSWDGLKYYCKDCDNEIGRTAYLKERELKIKRQLAYRAKKQKIQNEEISTTNQPNNL